MYNVKRKLTKREQDELFIKLARALALLHNPQEGAQFLRDLLSEPEVLMLARRLQIAELLLDGKTYQQIRADLKVSFGTIARVQTWLDLYGDGYRTIIKRIGPKQSPNNNEDQPLSKLKKKYPMYFWPELLLKEIIKTANKREKERLLKTIEQLRNKTQLSKDLDRFLNV
ncbi:MAG: hypothetical protein A3B10_04530 [Candidatus Doudnabacteria bacterium RIFCSPLOWO2_01_FULL_44_21]|uniref:TrpR like protein, YerC/YecD n=1 Tax=Candidatus Doudnabacteria bacterium RIFCSPLOWO2_01_FULL_44_21 TaxID=1817841 RepID=A0A1F5PY32_9BACT|nr:MAG: hypothetical protein A3B95_01505 [Candidatus Doudnabacteria bacterium RIFCSPHIGHO2_02_FULL_43_13b]OGE94747.1 MAG: hypothetical protein A3B10_04530 [Candidatus Doudnabacteria bacterium RIFCSPLOWO2_01_FULL_44_21]